MNKATFKIKLNSVMKDNMYDRKVANQRSGSVYNRKLYKIGYSNKVFSRRQERLNKIYNIVLCLDCSGSMGGTKLDSMIEMCQEFIPILQKSKGINLEVICFNKNTRVIKEFEETLTEEQIAKRINETYWGNWEFGYSWDRGDNNDGFVVNYATERLSNVDVGRKIIIMMSDGEPASDNGWVDTARFGHKYEKLHYDDFNLSMEVRKSMKKGIVFMGIGIMSNAVKQYYPVRNTAVVTDLTELFPQLLSVFNRQLKRA